MTLTAPEAQDLVTGAVYVYARSPCTAASLQVQGRSLIENRNNGEIEELVSVAGQAPRDWLGDGDCRVLTGVFGNGRNLSLEAPLPPVPRFGSASSTWMGRECSLTPHRPRRPTARIRAWPDRTAPERGFSQTMISNPATPPPAASTGRSIA